MNIYFTEVTTYANTNSVGAYVSKVAALFHHGLLTEEGWKLMIKKLEKAVKEAMQKYPRCRKEYVLDENTYRDKNGKPFPVCIFRRKDDMYDQAFSIHTKVVTTLDRTLSDIFGKEVQNADKA